MGAPLPEGGGPPEGFSHHQLDLTAGTHDQDGAGKANGANRAPAQAVGHLGGRVWVASNTRDPRAAPSVGGC